MTLVEGRDYRIDQATRTIYGRSNQVTENMCRMRGADVNRYVARYGNFGYGVPFISESWIPGCYSYRDGVMIMPEGLPTDSALERHERMHGVKGDYHP